MRSLASFLLAIAATLMVIIAAWLLLRSDLFESRSRTTTIPVVEQIKLVAKLQTVEYHGTNTIRREKQGRLGTTTVVYLVVGKVIASVDLEKMGIEVPDRKMRRVRLKLPEIAVDDPVVSRLEILVSCEQFLAPALSDDERNSLHQEALRSLKIAAQMDGIRDKARKQAEEYLRTFLRALDYEVEFA